MLLKDTGLTSFQYPHLFRLVNECYGFHLVSAKEHCINGSFDIDHYFCNECCLNSGTKYCFGTSVYFCCKCYAYGVIIKDITSITPLPVSCFTTVRCWYDEGIQAAFSNDPPSQSLQLQSQLPRVQVHLIVTTHNLCPLSPGTYRSGHTASISVERVSVHQLQRRHLAYQQ